jgi:hypothetical protein
LEKGVIGSNFFGCGQLIEEEQRQKSFEYVLNSGNLDCMTIGFKNIQQIDDAIEKIMKIVKA